MEQVGKARRVGLVTLCCTILFRLFAAGVPARAARLLTRPEIASFLIYLETGQIVRSFDSDTYPYPPESAPPNPPVKKPPPPEPTEPAPTLPAFQPRDLDALSVTDSFGYGPDWQTLLTQPLNWDLTAGGAAVLILHTHTTESYTQSGTRYAETARYRTLEPEHNMLAIGDRVAKRLEQAGISVIHDRELHDYPDYTGAYAHARSAIRTQLESSPSIRLVLDLHRDAAQVGSKQLRTLAEHNGSTSAQLMLVMGTGSGGASNPYWLDNLALAAKLHILLERSCPGLMRPLELRSQRFNQDLLPGALLIEVGAAGNTREEALRAADLLADGLIGLSKGTN